jgi:hypothetical protein
LFRLSGIIATDLTVHAELIRRIGKRERLGPIVTSVPEVGAKSLESFGRHIAGIWNELQKVLWRKHASTRDRRKGSVGFDEAEDAVRKCVPRGCLACRGKCNVVKRFYSSQTNIESAQSAGAYDITRELQRCASL